MWFVIALVGLSAYGVPQAVAIAESDGPPKTHDVEPQEIAGSQHLAESPNFRVHCYPGCCDARKMAQVCETWRQHLYQQWEGQSDYRRWNSRCLIVIHRDRNTYRAAVGSGGQTSFGSTWITSAADRDKERRIDLLTDARGRITALGHELSHVVLADVMDGKLPLWANEGIALLADASDKQARHENDLNHALRFQAAFRCSELIALDGYPSADRIPAFYGQSASLVKMLCRRGKPCEFLQFLKASDDMGYERALAQTYGIASMGELERLWQDFVARPQPSQSVNAVAVDEMN